MAWPIPIEESGGAGESYASRNTDDARYIDGAGVEWKVAYYSDAGPTGITWAARPLHASQYPNWRSGDYVLVAIESDAGPAQVMEHIGLQIEDFRQGGPSARSTASSEGPGIGWLLVFWFLFGRQSKSSRRRR